MAKFKLGSNTKLLNRCLKNIIMPFSNIIKCLTIKHKLLKALNKSATTFKR